MKLAVIGLGQCGGQIADEFARMQMRSRGLRGIDVITGVMAVDSDTAGLSGLSSIKTDAAHRLLIGSAQTRGSGTSRTNEFGAELMHYEELSILIAVRRNLYLNDADAVLVVAGAAGGTGSGGLSVLVRAIKEHIIDKPVYALVVLPFDYEENSGINAIFNTSACIKSIVAVADAVIMADNQCFAGAAESLRESLRKINRVVAAPFFNLLCASEGKKTYSFFPLSAADVMFALDGVTVISCGKTVVSASAIKNKTGAFKRCDLRAENGIYAMDTALYEAPFACKPSDAHKALFLMSAESKELSVDLMQALEDHMMRLAPNAQIRGRDYACEKNRIEMTVILSNLKPQKRMSYYHDRALRIANEHEKRREDRPDHAMLTEEFGKDIPTLL
ncbi:MAG: cell division protein FtsZ [Dehalococcoidia bacterium]|nr:cell division protein FtsZ [Dehalococcoidia bacterium]